MNNLRLFESKKLHYRKYLYKLEITNPLSGIFRTENQRGGKLEYARSKLDDCIKKQKQGDVVTSVRFRTQVQISNEQLHDANVVYKVLRNASEYLVRCERQSLMIYTNDKSMLLSISQKLKSNSADPKLWEPDLKVIDFLKQNQNVVVVDYEPEFPFKIIFGKKPGKPELANWIDNNRDKVKIGSVLLNNLRNSVRWIHGQYMYVKDENIIFLLQIMIGDNIHKVDKLVNKADIDK